MRDHPRVCGEKSVLCRCCCLALGSPPRMRGKVKSDACPRPRLGITPAYAGKSREELREIATEEDHPRVCGEKLLPRCCMPYSRGSPPRMRGKGLSVPSACWQVGITPAYAGKSFNVAFIGIGFEDHPRVCGEKKRLASCAQQAEGSPPRMRGKAIGSIAGAAKNRITPAYAGKRIKNLLL